MANAGIEISRLVAPSISNVDYASWRISYKTNDENVYHF
jgi:hypothetical protein